MNWLKNKFTFLKQVWAYRNSNITPFLTFTIGGEDVDLDQLPFLDYLVLSEKEYDNGYFQYLIKVEGDVEEAFLNWNPENIAKNNVYHKGLTLSKRGKINNHV